MRWFLFPPSIWVLEPPEIDDDSRDSTESTSMSHCHICWSFKWLCFYYIHSLWHIYKKSLIDPISIGWICILSADFRNPPQGFCQLPGLNPKAPKVQSCHEKVDHGASWRARGRWMFGGWECGMPKKPAPAGILEGSHPTIYYMHLYTKIITPMQLKWIRFHTNW